MKVLLVDDMPAVVKAVEEYLGHLGFQVRLVTNLVTALDALVEWHPDYVVTDLDLVGDGVGQEGYHVARYALRVCQAKKVVILTGFPGQLPEDLGEVPVVAKPIRLQELCGHLRP